MVAIYIYFELTQRKESDFEYIAEMTGIIYDEQLFWYQWWKFLYPAVYDKVD